MCGRFVIAKPKFSRIEKVLESAFAELQPRYNVCPTQNIPVIRKKSAGGYEMVEMRWGLVPTWAKDPAVFHATFNARAETVAEKPSFRAAFRARRCLIPVSGFYEWKAVDKRKQAYYITGADEGGLALAGLWEERAGQGASLLSCTIIVGEPNELVATVHDRMPVILSESACADWLDPHTPTEVVSWFLQPYPASGMLCWTVSPSVNQARNDFPELIQPLADV
jgi:putative SOS response-associated peptidase YedK